MIVDGVEIISNPADITEEIARNLIAECLRDSGNAQKVAKIIVTPCIFGGFDVKYISEGRKFERIRRITGYLTGDLTSWNDAKKAEEVERVKHEFEGYE